MQTIAAAAVITYYLAIQSAEYYLSSEIPGRVVGSAARVLGIPTEARPEVLVNLFRGLSPDGKKSYVQQQNYRDVHRGCGKVRRKAAGWDATWSVSKSVSILWAIAPPDVRKHIEEAVHCAVDAAVAYLEQHAAFTRRGKGGSRREPVKLVIGTFTHATSRAGDPQLHVHGVIFNIGLREDGETGTIVSKPLFQHQKASGAVFRATLANELRRRLKLSLVRTRHGFEIDGVPQELIRHFSKRTRDIKAKLAKLDKHTPEDAARATLATRPPKSEEPPIDVLRARWQKETASLGFTYEKFQQSRSQGIEKQQKHERFGPVIATAKKELNATRDVFAERDLVQQTLDASIPSGLDVNLVIEATKERLRDKREFVKLQQDERNGKSATREPRYITRATSDELTDIARRIKRLAQDRSFVVRNDEVERSITRFNRTRNPALEEIKYHATQLARAARKQSTQPINRKRVKQLAAAKLDPRWAVYLRGIIQRPGRVIVMQDWPSPQRDLALKAAAQAWSQSGKSVIACTRSLKHAADLQASTNISTMSVRRLELKCKPTLAYQLRWHAAGLVRTALGARVSRQSPPPPLDESKVLLVDRADQLRPAEIELIVRESEQYGAKVVFLTTPRHKHVPGRNQATASLLDRFAIHTWRHQGRTWQSEPFERSIRNEQPQAPEMEF